MLFTFVREQFGLGLWVHGRIVVVLVGVRVSVVGRLWAHFVFGRGWSHQWPLVFGTASISLLLVVFVVEEGRQVPFGCPMFQGVESSV